MSDETPNIYIITYSNWLEFDGQILAFKKQQLFNITKIPTWVPFNISAQAWLINRKQLTVKRAKELIKNEERTVDVSGLQWYIQEQLNYIFNLKNLK